MLRSLCQTGLSFVRGTVNSLQNLVDPPLVVLLYHRVCDLSDDPFQLAVSPDNFRNQLKYLKDNWPIIRLKDIPSYRGEQAVAVSFDDGYADNLIYALPILEEFEVPATFFITSGYLDSNKEFWWDYLEGIALLSRYDTAEQVKLHGMLKGMAPLEREQHIKHLCDLSGYSKKCRESHRPLAKSELQCLAASNWADIGAHGVSHTAFSSLSNTAQLDEMRSSRECLQLLLQKEIDLFSYPFGGKNDFTADSVLCCKEAGFSSAYLNIPGQVHSWTNPCKLPRNLVRNWPVEVFAQQMNRFWTV